MGFLGGCFIPPGSIWHMFGTNLLAWVFLRKIYGWVPWIYSPSPSLSLFAASFVFFPLPSPSPPPSPLLPSIPLSFPFSSSPPLLLLFPCSLSSLFLMLNVALTSHFSPQTAPKPLEANFVVAFRFPDNRLFNYIEHKVYRISNCALIGDVRIPLPPSAPSYFPTPLLFIFFSVYLLPANIYINAG